MILAEQFKPRICPYCKEGWAMNEHECTTDREGSRPNMNPNVNPNVNPNGNGRFDPDVIQNLLRAYIEKYHWHQITGTYADSVQELVALNNIVTIDLNQMARFLAEGLK